MKARFLIVLAALNYFAGALTPAFGNPLAKPIDATVCSIIANPGNYDNKLVKVSGYLVTGPESSILASDDCPVGIWFVLEENAPVPGLIATAGTVNPPKRRAAKARVSITLVKDSSYSRLIGFLERSAKGESCLDEAPRASAVPDCRTYRISATFTGRIDGVQSEKASGYGHMGLFKAQLLVQTIQNVQAVDREDLKQKRTK